MSCQKGQDASAHAGHERLHEEGAELAGVNKVVNDGSRNAQQQGDHPWFGYPPYEEDDAGCSPRNDPCLGGYNPVTKGDRQQIALHHGDQARGTRLRNVLNERLEETFFDLAVQLKVLFEQRPEDGPNPTSLTTPAQDKWHRICSCSPHLALSVPPKPQCFATNIHSTFMKYFSDKDIEDGRCWVRL